MRKWRHLLGGRLLPTAAALLLMLAAGVFLAVKIPRALAPIALGERLFSLAVGMSVLSGAPREGRAGRLFLLLLLPWIGAVCCLFLQKPRPFPLSPVFFPFEDGVANAVSALALRGCGTEGCYASSADYFSTGEAFYPALLADLNCAKRTIRLEYYILAHGKFFDDVLTILEQKAKNGVEVSVVYDDFGCAATLPRNFCKTLKKKGISAQVFHPLRPFPFSRLNRRDHRKLALIDGAVAYFGGINLADEYIGARIRFGHWKDSAVRVTGDPAAALEAKLTGAPFRPANSRGLPCAVFSDRAENAERTGEEILLRLIGAATRSLTLRTPYLAPTERIRSALVSAARAGVSVRLMIPHIPDKRAVFALTRSYAAELEREGVSVREYTPGFLHEKTLVADGRYVVAGSYNLDGRSLRLQAENGCFLVDEKLAAEMERDFSEMWETGSPLPPPTARRKASAFFLKLFAPLV